MVLRTVDSLKDSHESQCIQETLRRNRRTSETNILCQVSEIAGREVEPEPL